MEPPLPSKCHSLLTHLDADQICNENSTDILIVNYYIYGIVFYLYSDTFV